MEEGTEVEEDNRGGRRLCRNGMDVVLDYGHPKNSAKDVGSVQHPWNLKSVSATSMHPRDLPLTVDLVRNGEKHQVCLSQAFSDVSPRQSRTCR